MKKIRYIISISCLLIVSALTGCSTNMFSKAAGGAAAGAVSASFVGGVTDLILDGEINTDRLARNMVGGAVGGATAGAVVGHRQDQQEAQRAAQEADKKKEADKELIKKIGKENYAALNDLLNYKHEEAFRRTLKSTKSRNEEQKKAGYAIQALIDKDRGNKEGMNEAIDALLEINSDITRKEAEKGLKQLSSALNDERRAQGIRKP